MHSDSFARQFHTHIQADRALTLGLERPKRPPRSKRYDRAKKVILSPISDDETLPILHYRHSQEADLTTKHPFSFADLSYILTTARAEGRANSEASIDRPYASVGDTYGIELYVATRQVESLAPAVYYHNAESNTLHELFDSVPLTKIKEALKDEWVRTAPVILILTLCFDRLIDKYNDFGYQAGLLEAGMLAQNIQLSATHKGLSCCPIFEFDGHAVDAALDITQSDEVSVLTIAIGNPPAK